MSFTLPTQIRKESNLKGYKPRVGVRMADIAEYFSRMIAFTVGGDTFTDEMQNGPVVSQNVSQLGGLSDIGSMDFSITNQDLFSDKFAEGGTYEDPEYLEAKAELYFDDGTALQADEVITFYRGRLTDFPDITYDRCTFQIDSMDPIKDRVIGNLLLGDDSILVGTVFSESIGKMKPIVYGDHRFRYGGTTVATATASQNNNTSPALRLWQGENGDIFWLIADHEVLTLDALWAWDPDLRKLVEIDSGSWSTYQNNSDGCIVQVDQNPVFIDYVFGDATVSNENNVAPGDWTNDTNGNDRNMSTYTESDFASGVAAAAQAEIDLDFGDYSIPAAATLEAGPFTVYAKTWWSSIGSAASQDFSVNGQQMDGVSGPVNTIAIQTAGTVAATQAGIESSITIHHSRTATGPYTARVYEVWKKVEYTRTDILEVYFGGRGREYGDWINDRNTTDGYTETHADDGGSGTLIENPAGIIESLLRDELDLNDQILDESNFATFAKWQTSGDWTTAAGLADYTFSAFQTSNLGQTAANRLKTGEPNKRFIFKYDVTEVVAADGDLVFQISTTFANTAVNLPKTTGTHIVTFTSSSNANTQDFIIAAIASTGTQGRYTFDNFYLEESEINLDSFNISSNDFTAAEELSFSILEQIDGAELISDMLQTIKSALWYDNNNEAKIKTYVPNDNFSASGDSVPNNWDIFEYDPQTTFKIEAGVNDKLDFTEGGAAQVATLTAGQYTGATLASHIQTVMNAAAPANTYGVLHNTTTGIFAIARTLGAATIDLDWNTGPNAATSVGRFIGYDISADDTGATAYVGDYPLWGDSFVENPIIDKSFELGKAKEEIVNDQVVYYWQNYLSDSFQANTTQTITTYFNRLIFKEYEHKYTNIADAADAYLDILARLSRKRFLVTFKTWLNGIGLELWDIINIRHPLLTNLVSNVNTKKWMVLSIQVDTESLEIQVTAVEV